ncbi:MAG: TonB-dependent receptor [Pyrinomonadaceae bacterium]|nr:TonB-dependent receptor [Pyrinomonadaceae bacterium]
MMDVWRLWFPSGTGVSPVNHAQDARATSIAQRFSWIVLLILALALSAMSQTSSAITGDIKDTNGAVLAGVNIKANHLDTGLTRTTTSEGEGRFVFPGMPVGVYELRAEFAGFEPLVFPNVRLTVNETTVVALVMKVSTLSADVTINSGEALVNTQTPELSYLVSEQAIRDLPLNGRNYTDLALLQPGVIGYAHRDGGSVVAHGLGMSINGQDPRSNVYLLDGTPQNDFTNGPAGSAAGTVLGVETIREFRVEANSYGAEFGRNAGGQINAVSKSGTNTWHGSAYEFHRNDNFDARNFFDPAKRPEFKRNQFGGAFGGPIKRDKTFFFFGYESLREQLGQTIKTVVPDLDARQGIVTSICPATPPPGQPCVPGSIVRTTVGVNAAVRPYLDEFPLPNSGPSNVVGNLAEYNFGFNRTITQHFTQGRFDHNWSGRHQSFVRYTFDDADQNLPTDFPQFPRSFKSRNQFFTAEHRFIQSEQTIHTLRFNFSRTRVGQAVESQTTQPLAPFIPGRDSIGNIDIGGVPRFGPQTSVSVKLTQNVFGVEHGLVHTRGRHLLKVGGLIERYQDNMVNPTFSLGIWTFANLRNFLVNTPQSFLGLTPNGALDRYWRFTLFGGYVQDSFRFHPRLTLNAGLRYETTTMPVDLYGRDSALPSLTDRAPTVGPLYQNPTRKNLSPRVGFAWDVFGDGRTAVRGGYGIYFNTNNQQNLIVTVTNPPATPRIAIGFTPTSVCRPAFPAAPLACPFANSIRPVQFDLDNPYVNVYNLSVQRELPWDTVVTLGYAGSRGIHLLRSNDVNTALPTIRPDGTPLYPAAGSPRQNTAFSTIELKSSDGNSWYNAMIFEVRKRWNRNFNIQSAYTFSRNIDTTQASTFFSDATNGTTTAFPEFPGLNYNKGLADYHAKHNWVVNFTWDVPFARKLNGTAKTLLDGWQLAGINNARSGNPLTVFVQANRSRSLWQPSLGPGIGRDRASMAPGFTYETAVLGRPDQYFNPLAFAIPPAGTLGDTGRGAFIGPNFRSFDLAAVKNTKLPGLLGEAGNLQIRVEAFNLFNRPNFAPPALTAFAGAADVEPALSTFGRIRSTIGSSRQIQLGLRVAF